MVVGIYFVLFLITVCLHFFMVKVKKTSRNSSSSEGQKDQKDNKALMPHAPQPLKTQQSLPPQYTDENAIEFHNQQQK